MSHSAILQDLTKMLLKVSYNSCEKLISCGEKSAVGLGCFLFDPAVTPPYHIFSLKCSKNIE